MKLNPDCIRDIMLCVEDNTGLRQSCRFVDTGLDDAMQFVGDVKKPMAYQLELLKKYDNNELIYHLRHCIEANLMTCHDLSDEYIFIINDLTPLGHDFLAHIRPKKAWQKIVEIAEPIGATSLNGLIQIAANVTSAGITSAFKL